MTTVYPERTFFTTTNPIPTVPLSPNEPLNLYSNSNLA